MDASEVPTVWFRVPINGTGTVVAYLDPPYNKRQYGSNYHILNYIAKYDPIITIHGKGGIITGYTRSKYCSRKWATKALENLVDNLNVDYIIMSYNNQGIIEDGVIRSILEKKGTLSVREIPYKDYNTHIMRDTKICERIYIVKTRQLLT